MMTEPAFDDALILGGTGKIGCAFGSVFARTGRWTVTSLGSADMDAADFAAVTAFLEARRPKLVVNAVVFGGVDACETDSARALHLNAFLPRHLARLSRRLGFRLVHFSSDAVFSGLRGLTEYTESAPPDPINVYGLTKHLGDRFVVEETEDYLLLRIGMTFGYSPRPHQFFEKMIARAQRGEPLRVSDGVVTSPTSAADLAELALRLVEEKRPSRLLHAANTGSATLYEFLRHGLDALGLDVQIEVVPVAAFPTLGRRAMGVPLASTVLSQRPWREALTDYCGQIAGRNRA